MQKLILAFFLLVSVANAQEDTVINTQEIPFDKRVSVYLHPWALIFTVVSTDSDGGNYYLYATVEVPLSLSSSLIIRPSYWDGINWVKSEAKLFGDTYTGKRIGSDIGIRYYTNKNGKGFYYQGQIGLFYYNEREYNDGGLHFFGGSSSHRIDKNYMWVDFMGYIGKEWQFGDRFSMFFDAGLGYAIIGGAGYPTGDINLGIGIKIGKNKK